jgi:hypothetical protein
MGVRRSLREQNLYDTNVLAAVWLQFQTRDWFSLGTDHEHSFQVPRPEGDQWPDDPILLPRTPATRTPTATFVNTKTH